jgi:hypothetical protein
MITKLRDNVYLGDKDAFKNIEELEKKGITCVIVVADEMEPAVLDGLKVKVFKLGLLDGPNFGYVKDLACHIPKYMIQNGEVVLVQGVTGLRRGAFIAARAICEIENRSIYEIFQEIKELIPELNLSKVYF